MSQELSAKIYDLIRPVVEVLGFELWGCELHSQGRHSVLRVYIDAENGVTAGDCGQVSSQISGVLDVEDLIAGSYSMEVSSPGLDRILFTEQQFAKYIGSKVKIKLLRSAADRRNYVGVIKEVLESEVVIESDDGELRFAISNIDKAKLIPEF